MPNQARHFESFSWKAADYRICARHSGLVRETIRKQRGLLEAYIQKHPHFAKSLAPLVLADDAPDIALQMAAAAQKCGVGPMAAVAGILAQLSAEAALKAGDDDVIVENGGDLYMAVKAPVHVGLFAGDSPLSARLALRIEPDETPLALCSSSGRMGHSLSLGRCHLATVLSKDAALADAVATAAANQVKQISDIDSTLNAFGQVPGVLGILLIQDDAIGIIGKIPAIVRQLDQGLKDKITRAASSTLPVVLV